MLQTVALIYFNNPSRILQFHFCDQNDLVVISKHLREVLFLFKPHLISIYTRQMYYNGDIRTLILDATSDFILDAT